MAQQQSFVLLPGTSGQGAHTFVRVAHQLMPNAPVQPVIKSSEIKLRILDSDARRKGKTFAFRNFSSLKVNSLRDLRAAVKTEFGGELGVGGLKDVGYLDGPTQIWIRSDDDVRQLIDRIKKGTEMTLWYSAGCKKNDDHSDDGEDLDDDILSRKVGAKRRRGSKQQPADSRKNSKENTIEKLITELREKHGQKFTHLQYRLWAEMMDVGTHDDMDFPPNVPMFSGNHPTTKKFSLANAMSDLSSSISSAVTGSPGFVTNAAVVHNAIQSASPNISHEYSVPCRELAITPSKKAHLRSQYLQQIRELHSLQELGALDASETVVQKKLILKSLNDLQ